MNGNNFFKFMHHTDFHLSLNSSAGIHYEQNAIPFDVSRKMRTTISLRYLRPIFIIFIDILLYLKVLKIKLSSMKLKTGKDMVEKTNGKYWKSNNFIS